MEAIKNILGKITGFFNSIYLLLVNFLNNNRVFVVRRFALSYTTRIFGKKVIGGKTGSYPRIVLPSFIAFFIAIIATVSIDTLGWWEVIQSNGAFFEFILTVLFVAFYFIFWIPFIVLIWIGFSWFGKGYFDMYPLKYSELVSKGQRFQLINKPIGTGLEDETFPQGFKYKEEYKSLAFWHHAKFDNKKNVNVILGIAPLIVIAIGAYIAVSIMAS